MHADVAGSAWLWLALAAVLVGFAKTAIGGVASVAVVIFAAVLPARESTGALLPLLLCGDLLAVAYYRRHTRWPTLFRMLPGVLPGLVLGAIFIAVVDDGLMLRAIGLILLVMSGLQILRSRSRETARLEDKSHPHPVLTVTAGVIAGFATMTANAAGPVMTMYLILAGLGKRELLGTGAWFFLVVNLAKVPFSVCLGLISVDVLWMDLLLVPAMVVGGLVGIAVISRIRQRQFELAALGFSALAASVLLVA